MLTAEREAGEGRIKELERNLAEAEARIKVRLTGFSNREDSVKYLSNQVSFRLYCCEA